MRYPFRANLSLKIGLGFLLVSLIPSALLGIYSVNKTFQATRDNAISTNFSFGKQAAQQVDAYLTTVEETIKVIAENIDPQKDERIPLLDFYREKFTILGVPVFTSFVLLNKEGGVINISPFNKSLIDFDFSHQDYYRKINEDKLLYVSPDVNISPLIGQPTIQIAIPRIVEGKISHILIADVSLEAISHFINQIQVGKTGHVFIIDNRGTIIAHQEADFVKRQQNISNIYPGLLTTDFQGGRQVIAWPASVEQVYFTPSIPTRVGWTVIFKQDTSEIFTIPNELLNQLIILFIAIPFFIIIATLYLSKQITIPLEKLRLAMNTIINQQSFTTKVNIKTSDEIEDLAFAFNQMTDSLEGERQVIIAERNKLHITISGITDAVIAVDLQHKITIFNDAARDLTGYTKQEVLGRRIDEVIKFYDKDLEVTPQEYCPISIDNNERVVFGKGVLEIIGKKKGFVNLISGKIPEGAQNNLGCILTMHDVTKEQELERMKLDFVSMAAHELRTPLTAMKGYIYFFMRDYLKSMDERGATMTRRLNISTQKLSALVENLLSISKIETGALTIHLQSVEWNAYVKSAVTEVINQIKDKKLELVLHLPPAKVKVKVDPLRINEVLSNLLSNAISFTDSGGKIEVGVKVKGSEVITYIQDSGQGIPKEALPHLFTKFFRVSGVLEQGSKGTGLGLYIAKSIINIHHGRIWAESDLGKGSTFSFALPID